MEGVRRKNSLFFVFIVILLFVSLACNLTSKSTRIETETKQKIPETADAISVTEPVETATSTEEIEPTATVQTPDPTDTPTATNTVEPTKTPEPRPSNTPSPVGMSRKNPIPYSETLVTDDWEISIVQTIRGEEAWQLIQAANMFNSPPTDDMEYLLLRIHVKSLHTDDKEHSIGVCDFDITGDQLVQYTCSSTFVVEPKPSLDAKLFSGGEAEGWAAYGIGKGETNLMLIFDELFDFEGDRHRILAIDENASIERPSELDAITPTDKGKSRNEPAGLTDEVITENWQMNVLKVVRGDEAWKMAQEENQFNDPPDDGMEYIAVKVKIKYLGMNDLGESFSDYYFKTTGSANVIYDLPSVVDPTPALDVTLYPGGEYEGWMIVQAGLGESGMMLIFEEWLDFSGESKRFIAFE